MVESGNFSLRSQGLNFLTSNIRECNLLVFIQQLHGLLRTGSTAVVLTCVYRERVLLPVKTRPGFDGALGDSSALSYTSFSAKDQAKSARSAVLRLYCICFHTGDAEANGETKPAFLEGPLHRKSSSIPPVHPCVPLCPPW